MVVIDIRHWIRPKKVPLSQIVDTSRMLRRPTYISLSVHVYIR